MATIDLKTLRFRIKKTEWEGYGYIFEWPELAYFDQASAETGLGEDEVIVTWSEMQARIARDIHQDA